MRIENDLDLKNYNAYRISAFCKRAFFPNSEEDILNIYSNYDSRKIIIGNGNNLLLSKEYYDEDFIIFNGNFNNITIFNDVITAQAGATLNEVSELASLNFLSGMEVFWDIPSSVGGGVVMNAGASGEEIKDVLIKVKYLDLKDLKIKEKTNKEINFVYRNSFFQSNSDCVVLSADFKLINGGHESILSKMHEIKNKRWEKQPRNYPNCGSVFKRPEGRFVGPMLDELGLKGLTFGGAQVSNKHSGFIINFNDAKGSDIINLIKEIQNKVREKFNVELEVEQRII